MIHDDAPPAACRLCGQLPLETGAAGCQCRKLGLFELSTRLPRTDLTSQPLLQDSNARWCTPGEDAVPDASGAKGNWDLLSHTPLPRTPTHRDEQLEVLGLVHAWRCLTLEQLRDFTGRTSLGGIRNSTLRHLVACGLIEVGGYMSATSRFDFSSPRLMVRPGTRESFEPFLSTCRLEERALLLGGREWSQAAVNPRHDLLAAELMLRIAEECRGVAAVCGPTFATADDVFGSGRGATGGPLPTISANKSGDALVIGQDGTRVVIELQAPSGQHLASKVANWVPLLERTAGPPVFVVFVHMPVERRASDADLRGAIAAAHRESNHRNLVSQRLLFARWGDLVSTPASPVPPRPLAQGLPAFRIDPRTREQTQRVLLLGGGTPSRPGVAGAMPSLYQSPHWLRAHQECRLFERLLSNDLAWAYSQWLNR